MSILDFPPLSRIRRNHGLEHATIHILSRKIPNTPMAGHSDVGGFWLLGELDTEQVRQSVAEALKRMKNGEHRLAVHPNCGTNFVTAGMAGGLAGALAMFGARKTSDKVARLPIAVGLATIALIITQPLGFIVQEHITTSGKPGSMEIVDVIPTRRGKFTAHRILTRD
ncbi:MAG TPA: DUF6391 domain-containing protein [Anaerolineales bacterium]|nr:DUF6391 domain-containing protein [Anaerolineales bacterium]